MVMEQSIDPKKIIMRLTTKSRYGTRLILDLALFGKEGPVRLSETAERQRISQKYLEKLIRMLRAAGLVESVRGPYGGYRLAKSPAEISVGEIVRVMEGGTAITDCAAEDKNVCGVCSRAGACMMRHVWLETSKAMFEALDAFRIEDLINKSDGVLADDEDDSRIR